MRIAALFCGLIAGLFALVAPMGLGIDLLTPFLKLWGATPGQQLLGTLTWYAPIGAAVLGGLLAFVAPGPGALLLAAAGIAWFGFGVFDAAFFRIELLVPGALSVAGGILAFLAGELELRRRRAARRNRREEVRDEGEAPRPRPRVGRESREREEAMAREAAFNLDPLTVSREEAPPRPNREIPLTLEDVVPAEAPETRRRPSEAIWPDSPGGRRSMFDRDRGPELQPRRSLFERPPTRMDRPERPERRPRQDRDRDYREREYYDEAPPPRRNTFVWIVAANAVVLVVLAVVVGYMMVERGPQPGSAAVATVAAVPAPAAPQKPAVAEASADDPNRLTPNVWPALATPGTEQPALPMAPADVPMGTVNAGTNVAEAPAAAPANGTFNDPYAYCGAVRTIDYVDNRYVGPRFTSDIAEALRVPLQSAPDRVSWRCVDGVVYACASFDWPVCSMTPTAQEMVDYCLRNPGVTRLLAPNGTWACEGTKPRLPDGASWPVDARGFFPNAWIPVLPRQTQPTG